MEPQEVFDEVQADISCGAIPVFQQEHSGVVFDLFFLLTTAFQVLLGPMEHEYEVSILLDGARLSQIGQPGALTFSIFNLAAELGNSDDWHLQLSRYSFQPPGDSRNFLLSAFV